MEELYEADVMWPDNYDRPMGASNGYTSPKRTRERASSAAPVEIPRARRRQAGESLGEEEGPAELIPPHVLVSRSRTVGKVAFSVCSGQGRTLKGRDLSHVRDSVLRMTGFLEG
ncbi:uncharacterized protein LOC120112300 [Phoenix dactylifera]|uniref:Uncharacterized protein LOC103708946 n=1 Tax=Phoenix dactylifera TaxID=42345 RepID=A0A8B9AL50_PHODC|nr:uncharacterized protein LOC103708946 [Phoenix dactylifera]XP_038976486.1 uncharacterized protein LOC120107325 [Phoenix dactylifera]XP_038987075.1 uncharacterized protein LOC120112300 [Phoenix dactylifera]